VPLCQCVARNAEREQIKKDNDVSFEIQYVDVICKSSWPVGRAHR